MCVCLCVQILSVSHMLVPHGRALYLHCLSNALPSLPSPSSLPPLALSHPETELAARAAQEVRTVVRRSTVSCSLGVKVWTEGRQPICLPSSCSTSSSSSHTSFSSSISS